MTVIDKKSFPALVAFFVLALAIAGASIALGHRRMQQRERQTLHARRMALPDTLRVVTLSGATTYFTYRDEEMGYQYELVKLMADSLGLPMTIHIAPNLEAVHQLIDSGLMDLSITPEAVSGTGKQRYRYTGLEERSGLVLVQRRASQTKGQEGLYVHDVTELLGKRIHVPAESRYEQRLLNLEQQLGGDIDIVSLSGDTINSEDLMAQVASREIDYTVVDQELARLTKRYYPGIDIKLEIGFPQRLRWITSLERVGLAEAIDRWAEQAPKVEGYKLLYKRYFEEEQPEISQEASTGVHDWRGEMQHLAAGRLSPYDALFQKEAPRLGWPWQILASIAYQESNFKAEIIGWSGARGLMGIMPRTGQSFGASKAELLAPVVSVRVAVDCLLATERYFRSVEDVEQRMRLTLAGYNAGVAHIQDAQRLARKYGADPNRWDGHVEEYIRLKSDPKYYTDPVCKYGYLRGRETYKYVREVMARYELYRSKTSKEEG
ncbi:MAG: transglycosylase SLT domain-containing protein [Porphyromonadaceae bacterium]|nr:transglycosylase SLT domain-containing protein [Porphyromonadaceae bacterium]